MKKTLIALLASVNFSLLNIVSCSSLSEDEEFKKEYIKILKEYDFEHCYHKYETNKDNQINKK